MDSEHEHTTVCRSPHPPSPVVVITIPAAAASVQTQKRATPQNKTKKRTRRTAAAPSVLSTVLGISPDSIGRSQTRRNTDTDEEEEEEGLDTRSRPTKRPRVPAAVHLPADFVRSGAGSVLQSRPSPTPTVRLSSNFFRRFPSVAADGNDGEGVDLGTATDEEKAASTRRAAARAHSLHTTEQGRHSAVRDRLDELVATSSLASVPRPTGCQQDIASAPAVVDDNPGEPDYKPVLHPRLLEVEKRLGLLQPEDNYCYIRDVVMEMNQNSLPKEVSELLATIRKCNYGMLDKVDAALRIKAQYDVTIYDPANRKNRPGETGVIKKWTIRSIFNYLTRQDNSSGAILEDVMSKLHRVVTAIDRNMYRAPVDKIRMNVVQEQDLRVEKGDLQNMLNAASKLLSVVTMRERLRQSEDGGSGFSLSGASRRSKAGDGDAAGAAGGKNKSVSALMGRASVGSTGFLENEIGRTKDRPF